MRTTINIVKSWLCFVFIGLSSTSNAIADIKYRCNSEMALCVIRVQGYIKASDVAIMKEAAVEVNKKISIVRVDFESNGGDLRAAMQLGREIRKHNLVTHVARNGKCLSACIFSFLGGVIRSAEPGVIGLHAPYAYVTSQDDMAIAKIKLELIKAEIRRYLSEVNVQDDVLNLMLRIPTDELYYLDNQELTNLGIIGKDVLWSEIINTRTAKNYGLSRQEYQKRRDMVNIVCGPLYPSIDEIDDSNYQYVHQKYLENLSLYNDCSEFIYSGKRKK